MWKMTKESYDPRLRGIEVSYALRGVYDEGKKPAETSGVQKQQLEALSRFASLNLFRKVKRMAPKPEQVFRDEL